MIAKKFPLVVLISGNGSNLQAIIDSIQAGQIDAEIKAVISDRANAHGLQRAQQANIPTLLMEAKGYTSSKAYDAALTELIESFNPKLIVLAGFMRILGFAITEHFFGRMINIHPSLLPNFRGLNTHQRALQEGAKEHGVTIHFVSPTVDAGPIIAQRKLTVNPNETPESLRLRVLELEHQLYPLVISWFCEDKIKLVDNKVWIDES